MSAVFSVGSPQHKVVCSKACLIVLKDFVMFLYLAVQTTVKVAFCAFSFLCKPLKIH